MTCRYLGGKYCEWDFLWKMPRVIPLHAPCVLDANKPHNWDKDTATGIPHCYAISESDCPYRTATGDEMWVKLLIDGGLHYGIPYEQRIRVQELLKANRGEGE